MLTARRLLAALVAAALGFTVCATAAFVAEMPAGAAPQCLYGAHWGRIHERGRTYMGCVGPQLHRPDGSNFQPVPFAAAFYDASNWVA